MKVSSNTAISLDGRINTKERGFRFFGSPRDHARMSRLRAEADAILVGGATFRNWPHPSLPDEGDRASSHKPWWNVVVTRTLEVPIDASFLSEPAVRPLFLTRADSLRPGFAAEAQGWNGQGDSLPVAWILAQLERRGIEQLLVEAGGDLLFQFLAADAIDEMNLTLCPLVAGGPAPGLVGGPGFDFAAVPRFRLIAAEPVGDEVFLRYAAVRGRESP